ncbi:hypothetical protein ACFWHX_39515, partial [Streptomyces hirsutus]
AAQATFVAQAFGQDSPQLPSVMLTKVTTWAGYPTLRAARELRLVTFALQTASHGPGAAGQARYRLDCVRGRRGPRHQMVGCYGSRLHCPAARTT